MSETQNTGTAEATGSIVSQPIEVPPVPVAPFVAQTHTPISVMEGFFTAIKHGAALVYNEVLTVEARVHKWETDNPLLQPFIDKAVLFAEAVLTAHGIPVPAIAIAGQATLSALKAIAAADATVQSGK